MPAGRPTKKTDQRVAILLDALENRMPLDQACNYAMIDDTTLYRWCREDENFAAQVKYARSKAIRYLIQKTEEKEPGRILKALDRRNFGDYVAIQSPPEGTPRELHEADGKEPKLLEAIAVSDGD